MTGYVKTNLQLGDSSTATQNFSLSAAAADGTMKLSRGNFGATSQDILTIDAAGKITFPNNSALSTGYYQSPDQVISAGGAFTLPHGLGTVPRFWQVFVKCISADNGYSVGDILIDPIFGTSGVHSINFVCDSTNMIGKIVNNANPMSGIDKTSGAVVTLTTAKWVTFVRAWA